MRFGYCTKLTKFDVVDKPWTPSKNQFQSIKILVWLHLSEFVKNDRKNHANIHLKESLDQVLSVDQVKPKKLQSTEL